MAAKRYVIYAFVLVFLGAGWAADRVSEYDRWDDDSEKSFVPSEIESLAATSGLSRARQNLIASPSPEAEVSVRVCAPSGSLTLSGSVELQFVRSIQRSAAETDATSNALDEEIIWVETPLTEELFTQTTPPNCVDFEGRGPGPGLALLIWDPGAFGDRADDELQVDTIVRRPIRASDKAVVLVFLLAALLLLAAGQRTDPTPSAPWTLSGMFLVLLVFAGASLFSGIIAAAFGFTQAGFFVGGLFAIAAYVAAALAVSNSVSPGKPLAGLAFHRISYRTWISVAAIGFLVAFMASSIMLVLPEGESQMQQTVQTSSGILSILVLALVAPWAEEFLLRGVLYGALERRGGPVLAVLVSASVFSLLHLLQHWGNLGPWLVVTVTGLVLSVVRWRTGSMLASTVTHLVYNLFLTVPVIIFS